jgi:hypothetical protein
VFHQTLKEMAKIRMRLVIKITLKNREACPGINRIEPSQKL